MDHLPIQWEKGVIALCVKDDWEDPLPRLKDHPRKGQLLTVTDVWDNYRNFPGPWLSFSDNWVYIAGYFVPIAPPLSSEKQEDRVDDLVTV